MFLMGEKTLSTGLILREPNMGASSASKKNLPNNYCLARDPSLLEGMALSEDLARLTARGTHLEIGRMSSILSLAKAVNFLLSYYFPYYLAMNLEKYTYIYSCPSSKLCLIYPRYLGSSLSLMRSSTSK